MNNPEGLVKYKLEGLVGFLSDANGPLYRLEAPEAVLVVAQTSHSSYDYYSDPYVVRYDSFLPQTRVHIELMHDDQGHLYKLINLRDQDKKLF